MTKKSRSLIVANWKMNPETMEEAKEIFKKTKLNIQKLKNIKVVICPPFVYLSELEKSLGSNSRYLYLGAQDIFWEKSGSFTGEIGSSMLKKESYVILGHSERRDLGENNEMISKKVISTLKANMYAILCIGEKERDEHGEYLHFLREQLIHSIGKLSKSFLDKLIIAYEPVWAIGKSEAMKPNDIYEISIFIKKILVEIFGQKTNINVPILYGGSVNVKNAKEIIKFGEVQGLLVGRQSLDSEKFGELLKITNSL